MVGLDAFGFWRRRIREYFSLLLPFFAYRVPILPQHPPSRLHHYLSLLTSQPDPRCVLPYRVLHTARFLMNGTEPRIIHGCNHTHTPSLLPHLYVLRPHLLRPTYSVLLSHPLRSAPMPISDDQRHLVRAVPIWLQDAPDRRGRRGRRGMRFRSFAIHYLIRVRDD